MFSGCECRWYGVWPDSYSQGKTVSYTVGQVSMRCSSTVRLFGDANPDDMVVYAFHFRLNKDKLLIIATLLLELDYRQ